VPQLASAGVAQTPEGARWFAPLADGDGLWVETEAIGGMPTARAASLVEMLEYLTHSEREVARLSQELASRYEEIDLLYAISEILGHTVELERAAQTIVRAVASVVGARRASILLLDETGSTLRTVASQGIPPGRAGMVRVDDPISVAARVIREHRPLIGDPIEGTLSSAAGEERGYQGSAFMSVPICYSGPAAKHRCIGVVNLTDRIGGDHFTPSDRKLVTAIANQVGAALENARLVEREKEQERLTRELELARRLQQNLLPNPSVLHGDAEVGVRCIPLESVGGDFYGLSRLGRGAVAVMVGDVSSHGLSAALLMASVIAAAAIHANAESSPDEILTALCDSLASQLDSTESHVTVFYGTLDPARGELVYANAGHGHAFRVPADGEPERLEATAPPIGLGGPPRIQSRRVPWVRGQDLLCIWTDGLADAVDPANERFGDRRILDAIQARRREHPEAIVAQVMAEVDAFAPVPNDDRTLLVVKV
jgi:sigma-B regulation protein RsbU (phosphoserine phosphatase)